MKAIVLINRAAGTAARGGPESSPAEIERLFRDYHSEAHVRVLSDESLAEAIRKAEASQVDAVVAGGGDGTISSVAGLLAGKPIPLGVLPLGTLNHFAKDLGIPLDLEEAVRCIVRGRTRRVDVGEVNGHVFINNSSIGAYPRMVREREEQRQQLGLNKWLALLLATFHILRRWPLVRVKMNLDGEIMFRTTPFVFMGNNAYSMNLFSIGARSRLDEGRLYVYTACCRTRLSLLRLLWHALRDRLEQAHDFEARSVTEAILEPHRKNIPVSKDGEVVRLDAPLRYRIRPGALLVLAPPA